MMNKEHGGNMNFVPKPWTPVEVIEEDKGIRVNVWGRVYDFGHECFPISITANGNELLEKPVSLVGEAYGESIV